MAMAPANPEGCALRHFVVAGRAGAQVRAALSLQSAKVTILENGTALVSDRSEKLEDGRLRYRLVGPVAGWVSAKTVAARDAPAPRPPAPALRPLEDRSPFMLPGEAVASQRGRELRKAGARVRLFVLYGVADSSSAMTAWRTNAPDWLEVRFLELPGHGQRVKEPLPSYAASDPSAKKGEVVSAFRAHRRSVAAEIADGLGPFVDEPYALYGFSLGAILVYEAAAILAERARPPPIRVFAAGRGGPHCLACGPLHFVRLQRGDTDYVLRWMGDALGFETEKIPPALRDRAGSLFRVGMLLGVHEGSAAVDPEDYWSSGAGAAGDMPLAADPRPLACPVTAIGSDVDATWPPKTIDKWAAVSGPGFARVVVPGEAHGGVMNHPLTMRAVHDALRPRELDGAAAVAAPPPPPEPPASSSETAVFAMG